MNNLKEKLQKDGVKLSLTRVAGIGDDASESCADNGCALGVCTFAAGCEGAVCGIEAM